MKYIKYLKIACATMAVVGCAGLGYAIFAEPANKMIYVYVFGIIAFLGLQAAGVVALYGILRDKDSSDK